MSRLINDLFYVRSVVNNDNKMLVLHYLFELKDLSYIGAYKDIFISYPMT